MSQVHQLSELTIKIKHISTKDVAFLAVSDSAWANSPDLCSQAGFMVAAIDKKMVKNAWGDFSLLRWKSFKQDRKTPSTLGAEMMALSRAIAKSRWLRSMWLEALNYEYTIKDNDA